MKQSYLLLIFFLSAFYQLSAQEWVVPAESSSKLSSFAFSDSTRKAGGELYNLNCKSCHGDPGKNNAVKLVPVPPDAASEQMQKNADGALFFKVSEGRGLMPSFKNTLSATDLWKIISYLRGYNDKYVQEVAKKLAAGTSLEQVNFKFVWDKEKNLLQVAVSSVKEQLRQPVSGAEMKLFVKRYFGNLQIDGAHSTDNLGIAQFNLPKNLPGDSLGVVQLLVKPVDETAFGEAKADTSMAVGLATYRPPLNKERAIWNVVSKTPVWLLLTYVLTVLIVWGLIFYVMLQLRVIYKFGEKDNSEK